MRQLLGLPAGGGQPEHADIVRRETPAEMAPDMDACTSADVPRLFVRVLPLAVLFPLHHSCVPRHRQGCQRSLLQHGTTC